MGSLDEAIAALADSRGRRMVTRGEVLALGGSDDEIEWRVEHRRWTRLHDAVYLVGVGAPSWEERVLAACLAGGATAVASHRAAIRLWGLDGLASAPVEVTVVHSTQVVIEGAVVHRSRRLEPIRWIRGIPVTSPERTLLESGAIVPPVVTEKAFASAWRAGATSPEKCLAYCRDCGGKGRTGTRRLREIAAQYADGHRAPGSAAEVLLWRMLTPALADAGIEMPIRQFEIPLRDGSVAVVDSCWPLRRKVVEVAGLAFHGDIRSHDYDVEREAAIEEAGYQVRTVTPRALVDRPTSTIASLLRFLGGPVRP
ncbi:MAG TPA: hypothetical protein VF230_15470 [Acidimicrobiales bacterium]